MHRRHFMAGGALLGAGLALAPHAAAQARAGARPQVSGPITGGRHGWPIGSYPRDLGQFDYVEEEYFISGRATNYRPIGELGRDSKWRVAPGNARPYTTRILVHKPRDPARFNGTVLVEWVNVTPGHENLIVPDDPLYAGFVYVAVSAQYVGVHGFPMAPAAERVGMTQWDPVRYRALSHPGDSYSYDIYTQAARLLREPGGGVNPLAGLQVRKMIATGASQSAARLRTYMNALHHDHLGGRLWDAYLPFLDWGNATNFNDDVLGPLAPGATRPPSYRRAAIIREDIEVPVMIVNTEDEAVGFRGPERGFLLQQNSDRFRLWEVAGAPHSADLPSDQVTRAAYGQRDGLARSARPQGLPGSHVTSWHCTVAAYYHMHDWINGGAAPPVQPWLRFTEEAEPKLIRDEFGIGTGGVRLPETDVPVEMNTALSDLPNRIRNRGVSQPFTPELLRQLYPTHENYVRKVTTAARAAHDAGVIRAYRVERYIAEAQAAQVPPRA